MVAELTGYVRESCGSFDRDSLSLWQSLCLSNFRPKINWEGSHFILTPCLN